MSKDINPVKEFEKAIGGALEPGELGVIVSKQGVGKTGCLVHMATEMMKNNKKIMHVSFSGNMEHVITWYKETFNKIYSTPNTEKYNEMLKNRVIMNFQQDNSIDNVLISLRSMITSGFRANTLFFDGYQLTMAIDDDVKKIKKFAEEAQVAIWFAVSPDKYSSDIDEFGIPESLYSYSKFMKKLIGLKYDDEKKKVVLSLVDSNVKGKKLSVLLDPSTMLLSK